MLFELTRHSDHHAHPHKPYPVLDHFDEAPQMPAGYPAMMVLAALPPLWFRVMNPRLKQVTSY
jgi:alkane 1-monooxygenase